MDYALNKIKIGDLVSMSTNCPSFITKKELSSRQFGVVIEIRYDLAEPDQDHRIYNVVWISGEDTWTHETYLDLLND